MSINPVTIAELTESAKREYLEQCKSDGGDYDGFAAFLSTYFEPSVLLAFQSQLVRAQAYKTWRKKPKNEIADRDGHQYELAGFTLPGELSFFGDEEHSDGMVRKVSTIHAKVDQAFDNASIKQSKADATQAAAQKAYDASAHLLDLADGDRNALIQPLLTLKTPN